jgi:hypothetical protein
MHNLPIKNSVKTIWGEFSHQNIMHVSLPIKLVVNENSQICSLEVFRTGGHRSIIWRICLSLSQLHLIGSQFTISVLCSISSPRGEVATKMPCIMTEKNSHLANAGHQQINSAGRLLYFPTNASRANSATKCEYVSLDVSSGVNFPRFEFPYRMGIRLQPRSE